MDWSEAKAKLKDFSSGTCHDDCCQENAGLANAIDSALSHVRKLEALIVACDVEDGGFLPHAFEAEAERIRADVLTPKENT